MANRIHNIVTDYEYPDGPAIVMGPETAEMFVTLIGALTAEDFKRRWAQEVERDPENATER